MIINAGIVLIGPLGTNFSKNFNLNLNIFIQENALESVVCRMVSILSRPQCVNEAHVCIRLHGTPAADPMSSAGLEWRVYRF